MKVRLLHPDRHLGSNVEVVPHAAALTADLGLEVVLDAAGGGDDRVRAAVRRVLLAPPDDAEVVRRRQGAVADALAVPTTVRELYEVITQGLEAAQRSSVGLFRDAPDPLVRRGVERLGIHVGVLRRVRTLLEASRPRTTGTAWRALVDDAVATFDEPHLAEIEDHLEVLSFTRGVQFKARIGRGGLPTGHVLQRPRDLGWLARARDRTGASGASFDLADRDDAGLDALARWRDQALAPVAAVLVRAGDDLDRLLTELREELAVLVGAVNLDARLRAAARPVCRPEVVDADAGVWPVLAADGLVDPALALSTGGEVVGNDLALDGAALTLVTGANQGGKSTLLRSLGTAQLLLQAGLPVPAVRYRGQVVGAVHTHFGREEDRELARGKLEEELERMRRTAEVLRPGDLLLLNESFAATNEREGSELAHGVIRGCLDAGVRVVAVTHLYELADRLHRSEQHRAAFLRAERVEDGGRTFRVTPGAPLATSFGQDLYRRILGRDPGQPQGGS
ncbi:MAG: MutS-related protein [Nitriliruptoraceae bacterium]